MPALTYPALIFMNVFTLSPGNSSTRLMGGLSWIIFACSDRVIARENRPAFTVVLNLTLASFFQQYVRNSPALLKSYLPAETRLHDTFANRHLCGMILPIKLSRRSWLKTLT